MIWLISSLIETNSFQPVWLLVAEIMSNLERGLINNIAMLEVG